MLSKRRELRNNSTSAESVLWNMLKSRQVLGMKFRRQHSIGPYILDFYCPQVHLCVELDGHDHYTQVGDMNDSVRSDYLLKYHQIYTIRFENCDIFDHPERVKEIITAAIHRLSIMPPKSEHSDEDKLVDVVDLEFE